MLAVAEIENLPVREAREGDPQAWDALFRRYQKPLYVYVYELLRDEQTALEIVQETFVAATRHLHTLREDRKFGSWLFGIAHQKCIQIWRKPSRFEAASEDIEEWVEPDLESPDALLIRKEQEKELLDLLDALPWAQRSVLLLFYLEGFTLDEISSTTGEALGTVKSRLHYARKALRRALEVKE
jgi:RNA polymerase sigma-70 factor (ECF subfamily)